MNNNKLNVYDFSMDFHPELLILAEKAWLFTYSKIMNSNVLYERLNEWYSETNHKGISENVKNGKYFFKVLYQDKKMIGFVSGNINENKLDRLYIDPEMIGKGIGTLLLHFFINELVNSTKKVCVVYCDKKNSLGISFYQRKGFTIIEEDDEDYKMVLKLKDVEE